MAKCGSLPDLYFTKKTKISLSSCHSSFLAESSEIEKHCFIAKRVKQSILVELSDAISFKDLSKRHFVSPTTINRVLVSGGRDLSNRFLQLPQNLCLMNLLLLKIIVASTVLFTRIPPHMKSSIF